jgi:hypothetical protein
MCCVVLDDVNVSYDLDKIYVLKVNYYIVHRA